MREQNIYGRAFGLGFSLVFWVCLIGAGVLRAAPEPQTAWEKLQTVTQTAETQLDELRAALREANQIEKQLKAAVKGRELAEADLRVQQQALQATQQTLQTLRTKTDALEKELAAARKRAAELAQLQKELERIAQDRGLTEAEVQRVKAAVAELEQQTAGAKAELAEKEKQIGADDSSRRLKALQADLEQEQKRQKSVEAELTRLRAANEQMAKTREAMLQQLAECERKQAEIAERIQELEKLKTAVEQARQIGTENEARRATADQERLVAEKALKELQAQIEAAEKKAQVGAKQIKDLPQLQSELAGVRKLNAEAEAAAQSAQALRAERAEKLAASSNRLAEVHKQVVLMETRSSELKQIKGELEKARRIGAAASKRAEQEKAAADGAAQKQALLQAELEKITGQLVETQKHVQQAEQLQTELAAVRQAQALADDQALKAGQARLALEKELAKLNKLNETKRNELDKARSSAGKAEKTIQELQARRQQLEQLQASGQAQQKQLEQLALDLEKARKERDEHEADLVSAERGRKAVEEEIRVLQSQTDALSRQTTRLDQQTREADDLRGKLEIERRRSAEAAEVARRAVEAGIAAEKKLGDLNEQLAQARQNLAAAEERKLAILKLREDLEKEQKQYQSTEKQIERDLASAAGLEKKRAALQAELAGLNQLLQEKTVAPDVFDRLREDIEAQKKLMGEAQAKQDGLLAAHKAEQGEMEKLNRQIKEAHKNVAEAGKQAGALTKLQAELTKAQEERGAVEAQAEKTAQALEAQKQHLVELQDEQQKLDQEYAVKLEQVKVVAQAREELKRERAQREQSEKQISDLAARQDDLARQVQALESKLRDSRTKNESLAEELQRSDVASLRITAATPADGAPDKENILAAEKRIMAEAAGVSEPKQASDAVEPALKQPFETEAEKFYRLGVQKWDAGDVDGALKDFQKTVSLDKYAAGAVYNIALCQAHKGDRAAACKSAYQAGQIYLKHRNFKQATRMLVFIKSLDPGSPLVEKMRKDIADGTR